jgi:hypothetical protein
MKLIFFLIIRFITFPCFNCQPLTSPIFRLPTLKLDLLEKEATDWSIKEYMVSISFIIMDMEAQEYLCHMDLHLRLFESFKAMLKITRKKLINVQ